MRLLSKVANFTWFKQKNEGTTNWKQHITAVSAGKKTFCYFQNMLYVMEKLCQVPQGHLQFCFKLVPMKVKCPLLFVQQWAHCQCWIGSKQDISPTICYRKTQVQSSDLQQIRRILPNLKISITQPEQFGEVTHQAIYACS